MTQRRGVLTVLFAAYLVVLTWTVLWKLGIPYVGELSSTSIKLVPFVPTGDAGGSAPVEILANVVLFIPFGLYIGLLAPRWPVWIASCTVAGASLLLEAAQYFLAIGVPDMSDLIANTAGGMVGIVLARLVHPQGSTAVLARVLSVATGIAVIATVLFVASPQRYAPPRDVGPFRCLNYSAEKALPTRCGSAGPVSRGAH